MDIELDKPSGEEGVAAWMEQSRHDKTDLMNLQMVLVTSSMNHEYARRAYEKTCLYDKKQALLERMMNFKTLYFSARDKLALFHPEKLDAIEHELRVQKQMVFGDQCLN